MVVTAEVPIPPAEVFDNSPHSPPDFSKDFENIPEWEMGIENPDFRDKLDEPVVPIDITQYEELFWELNPEPDRLLSCQFSPLSFFGYSWFLRTEYQKITQPDGFVYWDEIEKNHQSGVSHDAALFEQFLAFSKEKGINQVRANANAAMCYVTVFLAI